MQEVSGLLSAKSAGALLLGLTAMLPLGAAAGKGNPPKLPPQVQRQLMAAIKICRDAGGKPGASPEFLIVADLTGDKIADFVIDEASLNCEGGGSANAGTAGGQLAIFVGVGKGQAAKVFEQGVLGVKVDKSISPASIKVAVGGALCGQSASKKAAMSEMKTCWRPVQWNASRRRMEFAPLSQIEPMK